MLTNQEILRFHLALFGPMWLSNTSFVALLIMTMITSEEIPAQKFRLLNTVGLCGVVQLGGAASDQRDVFPDRQHQTSQIVVRARPVLCQVGHTPRREQNTCRVVGMYPVECS